MKKLIFAVALLCVTAAFEQKAATIVKPKIEPVAQVVQGLDSLTAKIEHLNRLKRHEK